MAIASIVIGITILFLFVSMIVGAVIILNGDISLYKDFIHKGKQIDSLNKELNYCKNSHKYQTK